MKLLHLLAFSSLTEVKLYRNLPSYIYLIGWRYIIFLNFPISKILVAIVKAMDEFPFSNSPAVKFPFPNICSFIKDLYQIKMIGMHKTINKSSKTLSGSTNEGTFNSKLKTGRTLFKFNVRSSLRNGCYRMLVWSCQYVLYISARE